jgi:Protein of unknown function (DUF2842)
VLAIILKILDLRVGFPHQRMGIMQIKGSSMPRRIRKLIGAVLILVIVCLYALVAMAVAQGRLQDADKIWQYLYYVVAGMGWVLPVMPVIRWMERPDSVLDEV